jgi:dethiobiotin synthetase
MTQKKYFVTGIDTEVGKTFVSTILVEALQADYQKLVQAGDEERDLDFVQNHIQNSETTIFPEAVFLKHPMSPHASAELEGKEVAMDDLKLQTSDKEYFIIEGAGGLMVPINYQETLLDWLEKQTDLEVILVSKNYLGSINHSLLSIQALQDRNIPIKGIIFNGEITPSSEKAILEIGKVDYLGRVLPEKELNSEVLNKYADYFKKVL